jgi:hypothetical protein
VITREDQVEQSVQDFVKLGLIARGYTTSMVRVRDSFPGVDERSTTLDKTTVAVGFNFDDGGHRVELGSELMRRVYSIEFWTFGLTQTWGRNVAYLIRALLEQGDWLIPLKAIEQATQPVIDQLIVQDEQGVTVTRQIANDPAEWDRFVYTTMVKVEDMYMPDQSLVLDT